MLEVGINAKETLLHGQRRSTASIVKLLVMATVTSGPRRMAVSRVQRPRALLIDKGLFRSS